MSVYYHSYNAFGSTTPSIPVDEDIQAQVNYEQDLLNRILALGITNEAQSKEMGTLLFAKIKGMHDRAEQDRLLEYLGRLYTQHEFVPKTREQVDYLVWQLRVNNWEDLDDATIVAEMQNIGSNQEAGLIETNRAFAIQGKDVRPYLKLVWSNTQAKDRRKALELATQLNVVRLAYKTLALGRDLNVDNAETRMTLEDAVSRSNVLSIELGLEKDVAYTIKMFQTSADELGATVEKAKITEVSPQELKTASEAEIILTDVDPELDQKVEEETIRERRNQWLIGGACLLGLFYILNRPQRS